MIMMILCVFMIVSVILRYIYKYVMMRESDSRVQFTKYKSLYLHCTIR